MAARVIDYLRAAGLNHPPANDPPYWGGAFLAWLAIRGGVVPPPNAQNADSWLSWGNPVATPAPGCVVVMTSGGGHHEHQVGLVERVHADKVYVTCGDHNGQVTTAAFPVAQVIGCRRPPNAHPVPAIANSQELRLVIDHQGQLQPQPQALTIDHQPATIDDLLRQQVFELQRVVAQMQAKVDRLEGTLSTLEITPLDDAGNPIPWTDFMRRSQLAAS